jgi:hypothetical protein
MAYKDMEKRKARRRAWAAANKEKVAASQKVWYAANKEKAKAYGRAYYAANKEKLDSYTRAYSKAWYASNPRLRWYRWIKSRFNLAPEQYDAMLIEQSGRCAMCDEPLFNGQNGSHIDHCHATGRVRGILHGVCNMNYVGRIEFNPEKFDKAHEYLARVNAPCQEVAA